MIAAPSQKSSPQKMTKQNNPMEVSSVSANITIRSWLVNTRLRLVFSISWTMVSWEQVSNNMQPTQPMDCKKNVVLLANLCEKEKTCTVQAWADWLAECLLGFHAFMELLEARGFRNVPSTLHFAVLLYWWDEQCHSKVVLRK